MVFPTLNAAVIDKHYTNREQKEKITISKPNLKLSSTKKLLNKAGFIIVSGDTDFGDVALGEMIELTFTIENDPLAPDDLSIFSIDLLNGNADFSISDDPIGGGTTGFGVDLAPGETINFSITFEPGAVGLSDEIIDIQSSDDFFPDGFTLDITGSGLDPCADVLFNINVFSAICPGDALGFEETTANADFYEWTGPNGFISNDRNPSIPNATTANNGIYTLYLEKGTCQLEENFDITIIFSAAPTLNLTGNNTICVGESLTINSNATNVASYQWTGPNNFSTTSPNASISNSIIANTGVYTLTVTSVDGCMDFAEFDVEVFDIETITIEPESPPCIGGEINLATSETIENITNLNWTGPNNFSSSVTFPTISNATSANSGTYNVTATYETGCTTSASSNITVGESPTIEIMSNDPSCVGEILNLSQLGDVGSYQWTGPNNFSSTNRTLSIPNLTTANSGNYNFELTGTNGCIVTETVNVLLSTLPGPALSTSGPFCAGEPELTITAVATDAINFRWAQPNTNTIFEGATIIIDNPTETNAGNYTLTVANEAGCTTTETINVGFNGVNPVLNIEGDASVCVNGTLSLMETGGDGMNHQWMPPGFSSIPINGTSLELNNITSEDAGTYTVTADNGNGCSSNAAITVEVNDLPEVVAAINTAEVCEGGTINLRETGRAVTMWDWSGPNNFTSSVRNPSLSNVALNASGAYTVTGTDENGCSAESSINATVDPVFNAGTGTNRQVCAGTTVDLSTLLTGSDAGGVFTDVNNAGTLNNGILQTTNLTAGNYRFIYSQVGDSDCISQTTIIIAVQELFNAGADVAIAECQGGTVDLISQLSGADEGGVFEDIDNSGGLNGNTFNTTNLAAGAYNLRYRVGGGLCPEDAATITVNIIAVPEDPQLSDVTYCGGGGALQLIASEGKTYSWSTGETGRQIGVRPTETTTYSVTVTNDNLCSVTSSATINVGTITDLTIAGETTICQGETTQLTISGAATYEWMPAPGISDLTSASPQFNPTENTTYGVVAQNEVGCTAFREVAIIVNELPQIQTSADVAFCLGTGATISASGTNSYVWTPALGLDNSTSNSPFANPETSTEYAVIGTDENGCSTTATVNVAILALPEISLGENQVICDGGEVTITASGGVNYQWAAADGFTDLTAITQTVSPNVPTNYEVIGTDENGCRNTGTVTIDVNSNPIADAGADQAICSGINTELTASGGISYAWSNEVNEAVNIINPTTSTSYTVTVTNEAGCTATDEVSVTVNELPSIQTSPDVAFCVDTGMTIAASGATNYTWSPAEGIDNIASENPLVNPQMTTVYTVEGTDENGCIGIGEVTVEIFDLPSISIGEHQAICEGEQLTLTASGGASYEWTANEGITNLTAITQTISPMVQTNYEVTGTDENECVNTGNVTIEVNLNPVADAGADQIICSGINTELTANGGISYAWSNDVNEAVTTINPITSTNFTVTVTNEAGCTATDEVSVTVNELPTIQTSPDISFCIGTGQTIAASGATNYTWSPAEGIDNIAIENPFVNPQTTTVYTVQGTDENGCIGTGEVSVEVFDLPTISIGDNQAICEGEELTLTASGGTSYEWTANEGITNLMATTQTVSPIAPTNYEVTGTDENGCINTGNTTIEVNENPVADAGIDQNTCNGVGVELMASGGGIYEWNNGITTAVNAVSPEITTTYTVKVTNAAGCTNEDEVIVTLAEDFAVQVSPDTFYCLGGMAQLSAAGGVDYSWSPAIGLDNSTSSNPIANPIENTAYEVTIKDDMGCIVKKEIAIEVKQVENFSLTEAQDVCEGNSVQLEATGGTTYNWSPAEVFSNPTTASQELTLQNSNTLTVEVTDEFGCQITDSVKVTIRPIPEITVMAASAICEGEDLTLMGNGDLVTLWNWENTNFVSTEQHPVINNINTNQSGTYRLTGTTEFGCEASATLDINVNPIPTVSIDAAEVFCENDPLILREIGGNNITNWEWANDQGGSFSEATWDLGTAQVAFTAIYSLKVTDNNGCINTAEKSITVNAAPKAGVDKTLAFCQGESIDLNTQLTGNDPNGLFESSLTANQLDGAILNTLNTSEGEYAVTYKVTQEGCLDDEAVLSIKIDEQKMAGLDNSEFACQGTIIDLSTLLQQASTGGVFETTNGAALNGNTFNTQQLTAGNYEITYTVGKDNVCGQDQANFQIEVATQVKAGEDVQTDICQVGIIDLANLLEDNTEGGIFTDISSSNALNGSSLTAENLPLGTYLFDYEIASINQCPSDTARLTINVKDILTAGMDNEASFCIGNTVSLTDLLVDADAGGLFTPQGSALPDFSGTMLTTTDLAGSTINFNYRVGGEVGCPADTAVIKVALNESPTVEIMASDTFFCIGEMVNLNAVASGGTGDLSLVWKTPSDISTASTIIAREAGIYEVRIKDINDCTAITTKEIKSNVAIAVSIDGKTSLCQDEDLVLQSTASTPNLTHQWQLPNGNTLSDAMLMLAANEVQAGTYSLEITDEFGCQFQVMDTIKVAEGASFKSNFLTGQTACAGDTLHFIEISEITAAAGVSYKWKFGDGEESTERDPVYTYSQTGEFAVTLEVTNQACENLSLEKQVNILACREVGLEDLTVYPNPNSGAFTLAFTLFQADNVLMEVFNRFGQKVATRQSRNNFAINESFEQMEEGLYFISIRSLEGQISETVKVLVTSK